MKQYEFTVECIIKKIITVEAINEEKAKEKMDKWEVIDEQEVEMVDWEIIMGPNQI